MSKANSQENLSILSQLVQLANVDSPVNGSEYQFLWTIAQQLHVSKEEFDTVFKSNIEFAPPAFEFDRIVQFHRLVLLMNIDGEVEAKQIQMIKDLGIHLGLSPAATNEVLDEMKRHPNNVIPPQKLISIFQTFHN